MHPKEINIAAFNYALPEERIAKHPLEERDASKLLIYNQGVIAESNYKNLAQHIPAGSTLVFNQTMVVHARLLFTKPSGGTIEVFCLEPDEQYGDVQQGMLAKGSVVWQCIVGGIKKWKGDTTLTMQHTAPNFSLTAQLLEKGMGSCRIRLEWDMEALTFAEVLHYMGKVPLPPYLNREVEDTDELRYQTIYAMHPGSVAAPTAGLHFTDRLMQQLQDNGVHKAYVTLHVGAGTFMPVKSEQLAGHDMHTEWIDVGIDTIHLLIKGLEKGIVAVGTTSMRTIESLYWIGYKLHMGIDFSLSGTAVGQWDAYELDRPCSTHDALTALVTYMQTNGMQRLVTKTQIMIAPSYKFRVARGLVTNFHQPQSTLLLLVSALVGGDWQSIYNHALANDYRFLSYGDGCLLWAVNTDGLGIS